MIYFVVERGVFLIDVKMGKGRESSLLDRKEDGF